MSNWTKERVEVNPDAAQDEIRGLRSDVADRQAVLDAVTAACGKLKAALAEAHAQIRRLQPAVVVVDPQKNRNLESLHDLRSVWRSTSRQTCVPADASEQLSEEWETLDWAITRITELETALAAAQAEAEADKDCDGEVKAVPRDIMAWTPKSGTDLAEAIRHAVSVACHLGEDSECGRAHNQLAEWLRELASFRAAREDYAGLRARIKKAGRRIYPAGADKNCNGEVKP